MKYPKKRLSLKPKVKSLRKRIAAAYQLAGAVVMAELTEGQQERLDILLLDVLSEPERYSAKLIAELQRVAMVP